MIKLLLMSKQQTRADGRSKFRKFFTSVYIEVEGEEEKGLQEKSITVKFDKAVDTSKFIRGILTVDEKNIDIPYRYKVREVTLEDGTVKKSYPHIYIKKVESYEERKPKTTAQFNLMDEAETEETDIDDTEEN